MDMVLASGCCQLACVNPDLGFDGIKFLHGPVAFLASIVRPKPARTDVGAHGQQMKWQCVQMQEAGANAPDLGRPGAESSSNGVSLL